METREWNLRKEKLRDKIQGVIFGAAIGDAVGLATEFMSKDNAQRLYGDGPIKFGQANGYEFLRDGHRRKWYENDFTDDTDQLLLILQCVLSARGHLIPEQFAFRLHEWTNIGFPELSNKYCNGVGFTVGSVIGHPEFKSDPHKASFDIWQSSNFNLAANGAVMRTSVLGIPFFFDELQVVLNAINCAKVTHADPRCVFSAVVVSVLVSRMLRTDLQSDEKYKIGNRERARLLEFSLRKTTNCTEDEDYIWKKPDLLLSDLCIPKVKEQPKNERHKPRFFQSLWNLLTKGSFAQNSVNKWMPNHKEIDQSRFKTPAKRSNDQNRFSTASCGPEQSIMTLIDDVVSDYKFLLTINDETKVTEWNAEIDKFCCPQSLVELELDERSSIGYTFKCLGSALFCFSRRKRDDLSNEDFFIQVITELTLEAGDADTNATVAGALLGARLGFKGIPKVWLNGVRHRDYLTKLCDELLDIVMKQFP